MVLQLHDVTKMMPGHTDKKSQKLDLDPML
jgi:hypothetical protein